MRRMMMAGVLLVAGCGGLDDNSFSPAVSYNRPMATSQQAPIAPLPTPIPVATVPNNPAPLPSTPALPPQAAPVAQQPLPVATAAPVTQTEPVPKQTFFGKVADTLSGWYQKAKKKLTGDDE